MSWKHNNISVFLLIRRRTNQRGRERNSVYSAVSQLNRVSLSVRCRHQMGGQTAVILIRMIKPKREGTVLSSIFEYWVLCLHTINCIQLRCSAFEYQHCTSFYNLRWGWVSYNWISVPCLRSDLRGFYSTESDSNALIRFHFWALVALHSCSQVTYT